MRAGLLTCLLLAGGCDLILPLDQRGKRDAPSGGEAVDGPGPPLDSQVAVDAFDARRLADDGQGTPEDGANPLPPDLWADAPAGPCDKTPVHEGTFSQWKVPNAAGAPKLKAGAVVWAPTADLSAFYGGASGAAFVQPSCTAVNVNMTVVCAGSPGGDTVRLRFYGTSCATDTECDLLAPLADVVAPCGNTSTMYATKVKLAPGTPVQTLRLQSPASTVERSATSLSLTPAP